MKKTVIAVAGVLAFTTAGAHVSAFDPQVDVSCDAIVFSHAGFSSAFGESESLKYAINGAGKVIISHGEVVSIDYAEGLDIQFFANYPGVGFDHAIGRVKPQPIDCTVVEEPEEPVTPVGPPIEEVEVPGIEKPVEETTPEPEVPAVEEPTQEPTVKPTPPKVVETARA